jgi:hypothetical protein
MVLNDSINSMEHSCFSEKLIVTQLVKLFSFYRTKRFITVFTTARHWFLSWARRIQSTTPNSISLKIHLNGVSTSFWTGRLERELQMVQLSVISCSCIAILWVSILRFAAITLCVVSQRVFILSVYFFIDSVRKLLDTSSYSLLYLASSSDFQIKFCTHFLFLPCVLHSHPISSSFIWS